MRKYRLVAKKGEGTFSEVLKAQNVKDGKYYAIKCMKNRFDSIDQVNNLREIQALRRLSPNQHIITLEEVLYDQPTGRLALVFELMDANLYELIRGRRHYLSDQLVRSYMYQLLKALDHMHRKGIFHRDIKPENILIESTSEVRRGLKLADFGSCRGIYSKQPYTEYISTRWYRAPECLLTDGYYGPEMDLWGAGCVFFEITSLYPLFPGTNELDQINRVHKVLGTPPDDVLAKFKRNGAAHVNFDFPPQKGIGVAQLIPHGSAECVDLITKLLCYDWGERMTAREALRHPYFKEMRELDARSAAAAGTGAAAAPTDKGGNAVPAAPGGGGGGGLGAISARAAAAANAASAVANGALTDRSQRSHGTNARVTKPATPPQPTISKALPTIGQQHGGGGAAAAAAAAAAGSGGAGAGGGRFGGAPRRSSRVMKAGAFAGGHAGKQDASGSGAAAAAQYQLHGGNAAGAAGDVHYKASLLAGRGAVQKGPSEDESALPPIMGILGRGNNANRGAAAGGAANGGGGRAGGMYGSTDPSLVAVNAAAAAAAAAGAEPKRKKKTRTVYDMSNGRAHMGGGPYGSSQTIGSKAGGGGGASLASGANMAGLMVGRGGGAAASRVPVGGSGWRQHLS